MPTPSLPIELQQAILRQLFWSTAAALALRDLPPIWRHDRTISWLEHPIIARGPTETPPASGYLRQMREVCPEWAAICDMFEDEASIGGASDLKDLDPVSLERVRVLYRHRYQGEIGKKLLASAGRLRNLRALHLGEIWSSWKRLSTDLPGGTKQIEELALTSWRGIHDFLPLFTGLRRLALGSKRESNDATPSLLQVVATLPALEELELVQQHFDSLRQYPNFGLLLEGLKWRASVRKISLTRCSTSTALIWYLLQGAKESLCEADILLRDEVLIERLPPSTATFDHLRRLRVSGPDGLWVEAVGSELEPLIRIVRQAPLTHLTIHQSRYTIEYTASTWHRFVDAIKLRASTLKELRVEYCELNWGCTLLATPCACQHDKVGFEFLQELTEAGVECTWYHR